MAIRRNSLVNAGGSVVGLVLFATLTPLYLGVIGSERYGILAIIWAFLAFFSAFDFGMGAALSYLIASKKNQNPAEHATYFWTAMAISVPFGLVTGAILFALVGGGFGNLFNLTGPVLAELTRSAPSLFAIGVCTVLSSSVGGLLRGREKFVVMAGFGTLATALSILMPVLGALLISPSLNVLIQATLISRFAMIVLSLVYTQTRILSNALPHVSAGAARELIRYGTWQSLSGVFELALSGADRFILGALAGSTAVTFYAVPSSILARMLVIPNSLGGAVLPQTAKRSPEEEVILAKKTIVMMGMLTPVFVAGVFLSEIFLRLWLGAKFSSVATFPMQILLLAYWLEAISTLFYFRALGLGRPKVNLWAVAVVIIPYLAALYWGISLWGIIGAAAAYLCRNAIYLSVRTTFTHSWKLLASAVGPEFGVLAFSVCVCVIAYPGRPALAFAIGLPTISIALAFLRRPRELDHLIRDVIAAPGRVVANRRASRGSRI